MLLELSSKSYSEAFTYPDKWADVFSIAQVYPENKFGLTLKLSEERDHRQKVLRHVQSLNKDKVEWVAEMIEYLTPTQMMFFVSQYFSTHEQQPYLVHSTCIFTF